MRRSLSLLAMLLIPGCCLSCRSSVPPTVDSSVPPAGATNARTTAPEHLNTRIPEHPTPPAGSANARTTAPPTLSEELKQMQQRGLPTTPEALQAPLPPAERNAAPLYRQLDALVKAKPTVGDDKIATDGVGRKRLTAEQAAKLRQALKNRADIGRMIHSAIERPECVFDRKWAQGSAMMFPEFARLRLAARWISAESALQLYDGKPLEAIKTQALGFRLARHTAQDPMLIAHLVAIAIDAITLAGMERILYAAGDQPGVAQGIQKTLETDWQPHSLAYGLRGEMILPLVEIDKAHKGGPEAYEESLQDYKQMGIPGPIPPLSAEDKQQWGAFVDRIEAIILHGLVMLIDSADKPYPEARRVFQNVVSDLEAHASDSAYLNARILFPVYVQAVTKRTQITAKAATVKAAAAIFDWKARHKTLPDTLESITSQVPADPFDGKPLHYKKEGNGFVVYSIGPTGKFDGGTPTVRPDAYESFFRYPMPVFILK